jgi:phosphate transport system ATP-binding protein
MRASIINERYERVPAFIRVPPDGAVRGAAEIPSPVASRLVTAGADNADTEPPSRLVATGLSAFFGAHAAVQDVSLSFQDHRVTAIIGPSGCGKSTLLRCLNRMHETVAGAHVTGNVTLDGTPLYNDATSAIAVRRQIGMVFQRPTVFPTMSIRDNVAAGLRVNRERRKSARAIDSIIEDALRRAGLWDEVKDRLRGSAIALSGGQQQRLCIARALATNPGVLLLDEPTASLDPASTQNVEELIHGLRTTMTVGIVTHNMQQAARISDRTAFMLDSTLVEAAPTNALFTNPRDARTEAYITGRFG